MNGEKGSWLFDVQAHGPTNMPFPNTVEDGQLLLLRRVSGDDDDDDDDDDDVDHEDNDHRDNQH